MIGTIGGNPYVDDLSDQFGADKDELGSLPVLIVEKLRSYNNDRNYLVDKYILKIYKMVEFCILFALKFNSLSKKYSKLKKVF